MDDAAARLLELKTQAAEAIQEASRLELQVCEDITKLSAEFSALMGELPQDAQERRSIYAVLQVLNGIGHACRSARHRVEGTLSDIAGVGSGEEPHGPEES